MFDHHAALLTQWVEEKEKLEIARQNYMAAYMHGPHHDMTQSQVAMQGTQAAAVHNPSEKSSKPYLR